MWWVLTSFYPLPAYDSLAVIADTSVPDHLFMAWQLFPPTRVSIYRSIRGRRILCGYQWRWDNPFIAEQIQHGDTTHHIFHLTNLTPASTIWYFLFAPDGPYGLEIQGPVASVTLPDIREWTTPVYFATQQKGIYYTSLFTPPGGPQPWWTPVNDGLHSLAIWQLCPDKLQPAQCQYTIAGARLDRVLYRRHLPTSPTWQPILTDAQIQTLMDYFPAGMAWVDTNIHHPGHLYVLVTNEPVNRQLWCVRSTDYGEHWTLIQMDPAWRNYHPGNIQAGHTLHAAISAGYDVPPAIYTSLDLGLTWTRSPGPSTQPHTPKLQVDPTNEATVYIGLNLSDTNDHELHRQTAHLGPLTEVDGIHHLGTLITSHPGNIWINPTDNTFARVLQNQHIYTTTDYCATWTDQATTQYYVRALAQLPTYPNRLYLARNINGSAPPPPDSYHTLFTSTNNGFEMEGKSGNHPHLSDGGDNSIPWNCGGVAQDGIMFAP